jgi:hypothetical protein
MPDTHGSYRIARLAGVDAGLNRFTGFDQQPFSHEIFMQRSTPLI